LGVEGRQGVAVAGGGGVGGDGEGGGDLGESEVAPELEEDNLALVLGEAGEGGFEEGDAVIGGRGLEVRWGGEGGEMAVAGAAAAGEGTGGVADAGEEVGDGVGGLVAGLPEVGEAFLHGVLCFVGDGEMVARKEEQGAGVAGVIIAPVV
jgi:hypothetical protein